MNAVLAEKGGRAADAPTTFTLGFISDQDENSRLEGDFEGEEVTNKPRFHAVSRSRTPLILPCVNLTLSSAL